jgi:hypothetical protein
MHGQACNDFEKEHSPQQSAGNNGIDISIGQVYKLCSNRVFAGATANM